MLYNLEQEGTKFHHETQKGAQFKIYKLHISENFSFNISDLFDALVLHLVLWCLRLPPRDTSTSLDSWLVGPLLSVPQDCLYLHVLKSAA